MNVYTHVQDFKIIVSIYWHTVNIHKYNLIGITTIFAYHILTNDTPPI